MSLQENLSQVAEAIRGAQRIALCSHISPDGDTTGTANALRLALEALGKQVSWFCQDPVPPYLRILPGWENCRTPESLQAGETFDLLLCVDISDDYRMGRSQVLLQRDICAHSAQIDHHGTNPLTWTDVAAVDGGASACAVVAVQLLHLLQIPLTQDMANSLYTAIASDTGSFAYSITAEAFSAAAELIAAGADVPTLHRKLFDEKEKASVKLLGRALSSMLFSEDGPVTVLRTTQEDYAACGATYTNAEAIVNNGLYIQGVKATVHMKATVDSEGKPIIKLSFRSLIPYDVAAVAAQFGGGGHKQAAGAALRDMDMDTAAALLMEALLQAVKD